jgi:hypothetical protein
MSDIKLQYHTISLLQQSDVDLRNNTRWLVNIDIKNILREYIFAKIKEARTFKTIRYQDLSFRNINLAIYNYIDSNILVRYQFSQIDFYVKYYDILKDNSIYSTTKLQYNPIWDKTIISDANKVRNINIMSTDLNNLVPLTINYSQIKPSSAFKFDYYFNLKYTKI